MKKPAGKHPLEWAVFGVSLALVLGLVGFLLYDAATCASAPPELVVRLGRAVPSGGGYAVPVEVRNQGDETAEGVHVEVALELPGQEAERADLDIAFVPRQSRRRAWVTFPVDPAAGRLTGRVLGYEVP
ncbi:MAG TPA: hypothetical protein VHU81_11875 [Thermoanaerobaculia bacterium]|jgi:uncharacterized protein (TIGR02588 family)|nr:hypothetical protein [Thermoanaerobaculia bacterium]